MKNRKRVGSVTEHVDRDGTIRFRARLPVDGQRKSAGLYDTREDAWAAIDATLAQVGSTKGVTLLAWGERWLDRREKDGILRAQHKSRSTWATHVAVAPFARWPLRKIARTDIVAWVRALLRTEAQRAIVTGRGAERKKQLSGLGRRLSRQTALNVLSLLSGALTDAADEGHVPSNVALGVGVPKVARSDDTWTYLELAEIDALLGSDLTTAQQAIFAVATYTGMRAGEIWGLRWADVVLTGSRPELAVRHSYRGPTKSGKVRRVPLLRQAREALEAWRQRSPGVGAALVFPAEGRRRADGLSGCHAEGFEAGFGAALKAAGIERRVRFHDLRHTCASHLVMGSWTARPWRLEEVQLMLGHASRTTTERYAHLAPEGLHSAAREEVRATRLDGHHMDTDSDR